MPEKSGYAHFMLKEICETPRAVRDTIRARLAPDGRNLLGEEIRITPAQLRELKYVHLVASGTSRHAGLAGKIMLEQLAGIRAEVHYSSEFELSCPKLGPNALTVLITQSGETADTLAALAAAAARNSATLAICNVIGSSISSHAESVIYTHAGRETAIASTKAFTAQLAALFLFAVFLGQVRGALSPESAQRQMDELAAIPGKLEQVLQRAPRCQALAEKYFLASDFLFVGRGIHLPAALDGALKLKEVSYIHAEGYPAGEIKHGPYALIDSAMPCVFLAGKDADDPASVLAYNKTLQDMRDVKSKLGRVIAVGVENDPEVAAITGDGVVVPRAPELLLPLLETVPLQLLAYHIGVCRGLNVDNPRNLVKSVTRE